MSVAFKGQVYNDFMSVHNNVLCILSAQVDMSLYAWKNYLKHEEK